MSFCPGCGNEVQGDPQFCSKCGHELAGPPSRLGDQSGHQAPLSLSRPQQWGLAALVGGGLLGLIGLFIGWPYGGTVGGHLRGWWSTWTYGGTVDGWHWLIAFMAIGAVAGVVITFSNAIGAFMLLRFPSNAQLWSTGILLGIFPLATRVGDTIWSVAAGRAGAGDVLAWFWGVDSVGLLISLTGGILVIWAPSIGAKLSSIKERSSAPL